jgi:hypothetical protein
MFQELPIEHDSTQYRENMMRLQTIGLAGLISAAYPNSGEYLFSLLLSFSFVKTGYDMRNFNPPPVFAFASLCLVRIRSWAKLVN